MNSFRIIGNHSAWNPSLTTYFPTDRIFSTQKEIQSDLPAYDLIHHYLCDNGQ